MIMERCERGLMLQLFALEHQRDVPRISAERIGALIDFHRLHRLPELSAVRICAGVHALADSRRVLFIDATAGRNKVCARSRVYHVGHAAARNEQGCHKHECNGVAHA